MNRVLQQSPSSFHKLGTALAIIPHPYPNRLSLSLSLSASFNHSHSVYFFPDFPFADASSTQILSAGHGSSCYWTSKIQTFRVHLPLIRGFTTCFVSQDLANKRCEPCNSKDIRSMTEQSANELLPQVPGWNLMSEGGTMKLHRSWKAKSFTKGLEFFQLLAEVAEAEGHHPDLHLVGWNNVKIDIWTHSVGGLTENDFILAAKINALKLEHLLRNKTTA